MSAPEQYPDGNPKTRIAALKVPMQLVPPSARIAMAAAFADGASKYGPFNWREKGVSASVYLGAAMRHIDAWIDGQEVAEDSGVDHLAHAMACFAIIVDARSVGRLNDDRPHPGKAAELQMEYHERAVAKEG
ncbi:hypothetical protein DYQ94_06395 [Xanthomonas sp. LMG 8993]|uniref:dATP/dGTP diphosphohydrolase domain-containing protein n=1 Tax=Xanthomonas TaxID=338 RepID=UPI001370B954|nr:dATP/dGTP diphosphohydrolase domain-containing protein [Xanthomonas arboricola]MBB4768659.1 hypothetical protein [Xanthomonas arboricola]MXV46544.1 hypothetical protein [Xanthomonas sp. LMG 8993]